MKLDEWDPINLISHAPEDVYDPEISDIKSLLPTVKTVDELALGINKVFVKRFGTDAVVLK